MRLRHLISFFSGLSCHQVVPERIKQPWQAAFFVYGLG
jgi:hypothetical protein